MGWDHRMFLEAHRPWSFTTADGRTFLARLVSAPACQKFDIRLADAGTNIVKRQQALWWILRVAFPWRFSYRLRGDPVKIIMHQLEPAARRAALDDFFECLRGENPIHPQSMTNGPRSSARTPHRTA